MLVAIQICIHFSPLDRWLSLFWQNQINLVFGGRFLNDLYVARKNINQKIAFHSKEKIPI